MAVERGLAARSERLNIRAAPEDKELLERAARASHVSTSQFVLDAALREAEEVVADQTHFLLAPQQWSAFVDALNRPARVIPELTEAAEASSPFDRG